MLSTTTFCFIYNFRLKNQTFYCQIIVPNTQEYYFVLKPDRLFLFQSMKRKQKSSQNEPSAGRFEGPPTLFNLYSALKEKYLFINLIL